MFEKVSEPVGIVRICRDSLQKAPGGVDGASDENASEGCVLEKDNVGRGAEELRARTERPALVLPGGRGGVQAHPRWST